MAGNDNIENNKRIMKNTLFLYVRMGFTMVIGLYTSRVVLNALGVSDFGIYNVVGGVVAMFSILSGSLSSAVNRYLTFALGRGDIVQLKNTFSIAVKIHLILAVVIFLLSETIGVWFLNTQMNIPGNRMYAANWVFQFSLIAFVISLISVPYNASIISHERMKAFAYIGILEVFLKLFSVLILYYVGFSDNLIAYSIFITTVSLLIRLIYGWYCKREFVECTYHNIRDKTLFKAMFSFAGWNFIGASSHLLRTQGINVLLNIFCGTLVNAANGIAYQVFNAISGFVSNFMTALNPQITKNHAQGNKEYTFSLVFQGVRFSYYLLLLFSLPLLINTHYILQLWLKTVPEHTVLFVRLILIFALSESLSNTLITLMLATGNIKKYQIIVGGIQMLNFPISYILLKAGFFPEIVFVVSIVLSQICLIARLILLQGMVGLPIKKYLKKVYANVVTVTLISVPLPFLLFSLLSENFISFLIIVVVCL
ncbi:MAG: oligosaccharide flippase family protein, partial [Paludibacter sp.]